MKILLEKSKSRKYVEFRSKREKKKKNVK